jgi:hypothetical protein
MTLPGYSDITDTSRPRPVRWAAFLGALATTVLATLAITLRIDPALLGSLLGVISIAQLGGWLFVEGQVTPTSSPAVKRDGVLTALVSARRQGVDGGASSR